MSRQHRCPLMNPQAQFSPGLGSCLARYAVVIAMVHQMSDPPSGSPNMGNTWAAVFETWTLSLLCHQQEESLEGKPARFPKDSLGEKGREGTQGLSMTNKEQGFRMSSGTASDNLLRRCCICQGSHLHHGRELQFALTLPSPTGP